MLSNRNMGTYNKCNETRSNRAEFAQKLIEEIIKSQPKDAVIDEIKLFIEDMLRYFDKEN